MAPGLGPQAAPLLAGAVEQLTLDTSETVEAARAKLQADLDDGTHCPVCGQFAKVYKRKLNTTMVKALSLVYKAAAPTLNFVHGPTVLRGSGVFGGDLGKVAYFDLVEEESKVRPDGGRGGLWRPTAQGRAFLQGVTTVPTYVHVYDGRVLGFSGEPVDVAHVAPRFDYKELMNS